MRIVPLFLDNSSFVNNLQCRRDSSFYLCGEIARYIYRLCFRCYSPDTIPLENSWFLLLNFQTSEGTFMPADEFLTRLKMTNKVAKSCKQKAEGVHSGKKIDRAAVQKTATTIKNDFVRDTQSYLQYLIGTVLRQAGLCSNLVRGLAAFDPHIMVHRATEVALRHFDLLYRTFQLRSWVSSANESACRDEYVELLDQLRASILPSFDVTQGSADLIDFLINLDFMQEHSHLLYLFKLSCLCVTSNSPRYPVVTVGSLSTSNYRSRLTDVVLPVQSYLSGVPDSVAFCSNESNLSEFSLLSASFGRSALSSSYDPWTFIDVFGRGKIYKTLLTTYRSALSGLGEEVGDPDRNETSTFGEAPAVVPPSDRKRRRMEKSNSRSRASSVVEDSPAGTSKD